MNTRSNQLEVRNPVLSLPSAQRISDLPPESRATLAALLRDLSADARGRAQKSWKSNKGPMAVYWKAVGAYATHLYRAIRPDAPKGKAAQPLLGAALNPSGIRTHETPCEAFSSFSGAQSATLPPVHIRGGTQKMDQDGSDVNISPSGASGEDQP